MRLNQKNVRAILLTALLCAFMTSGIPASQAALSVGSNSGNYQSSTGGGGLASPVCPSNGVLSGIGAQTTNYEVNGTYKATLTQVTGACATINADGQSIASVTNGSLGPYGSSTGTSLADATCGTANGTQVIVGARLYKTSTNSFAGGVTLLCGTLPTGGSRTWGASIGTTSGSYEDIACVTGSVANGLYVNYGGILDRFGISCAPIINVPQTITVSLGSTTSAIYPYTQVLGMSTSGSRGSGSITYSISGGTATNCTLSSTASNATLTAASSGTCLITATIASDSNYASSTSTSATFTFSQAGQIALTLTSTSGSYGTTLNLTTSGGSGTGAVTFTTSPGSTTCTVSTNTISANGAGTCSVTATKAADTNYNSISSSATTVTFSQGISTLNLTVAGGAFTYRQAKLLTAVVNAPGKITFKANNVLIAGCRNISVNVGNYFTATCNYKTSVHGALKIVAIFTPTSSGYLGSTSSTPVFYTLARSTPR